MKAGGISGCSFGTFGANNDESSADDGHHIIGRLDR